MKKLFKLTDLAIDSIETFKRELDEYFKAVGKITGLSGRSRGVHLTG